MFPLQHSSGSSNRPDIISSLGVLHFVLEFKLLCGCYDFIRQHVGMNNATDLTRIMHGHELSAAPSAVFV
jgi:hypothetical protein